MEGGHRWRSERLPSPSPALGLLIANARTIVYVAQVGTVWEGTFNLDIYFCTDYPSTSPRVKFTTRIYHPNVDELGFIAVKSGPHVTICDAVNDIRLRLSRPVLRMPVLERPYPVPQCRAMQTYDKATWNADAQELYLSDLATYEAIVSDTVSESPRNQAMRRAAVARLLLATAILEGTVAGCEVPLELLERIAMYISALSKQIRWAPFGTDKLAASEFDTSDAYPGACGVCGSRHRFQNAFVNHCTVSVVDTVTFPPPSGLKVNMMPFIMGQNDSVPEHMHGYLPLIEACRLPRSERGKVGYLTIDEAEVNAGESHRRGGLHIDCPGMILGADGAVLSGTLDLSPGWGGDGILGMSVPNLGRRGGIYMASSIPNSTRVWGALIDQPANVADSHGGIEHLRGLLGEGHVLPPCQLTWMTDRTPHESLCLEKVSYRQYFRLVTSNVTVWYEKHSTANPLGILPDPEITTTLTHDKFDVALVRAQMAGCASEARIGEGIPPQESLIEARERGQRAFKTEMGAQSPMGRMLAAKQRAGGSMQSDV